VAGTTVIGYRKITAAVVRCMGVAWTEVWSDIIILFLTHS